MPRMKANLIVVTVAALLAGSIIAEDGHEHNAHAFAKDVDPLHAVLAPLWHSPPGKERSEKVCESAQKLENLAAAIRNAEVKPLLSSIAVLKAQCKTNPNDIDTAFSQVHEAFHRLAEPKEH